MPRGRKKKVEIVVDDEIIDNPEEVTIEDVLPPLEIVEEKQEDSTIIETGNVNNGKREFKNVLTGITFYED